MRGGDGRARGLRARCRFERASADDISLFEPINAFRDEDLVVLAEAAGFSPVRLELQVEVRPVEPVPWETFVRTAWNPRIPTVEEALLQTPNPAERAAFAAHLRPLVEEGRGTYRMARASFWAAKPL